MEHEPELLQEQTNQLSEVSLAPASRSTRAEMYSVTVRSVASAWSMRRFLMFAARRMVRLDGLLPSGLRGGRPDLGIVDAF